MSDATQIGNDVLGQYNSIMSGTQPVVERKGWVLANLVDNHNVLVGYEILTIIYKDGKVAEERADRIALSQLPNLMALQNMQFFNAKYDAQVNALVGIPQFGILGKYPYYNPYNGSLRDYKNGLTLVRLVRNKDTDELIGFVGYDAFGKKIQGYIDDIDNYKSFIQTDYKYTDGVLYNKIGEVLDEKNFEVVRMRDRRHYHIYSKSQGDEAPKEATVHAQSIEEVGIVDVTYLTEVRNSPESREMWENGTQKLLLAMNNLRKVSPYYYTLVTTIQSKGKVIPVRTPFNLNISAMTEEDWNNLDDETREYVKVSMASGHGLDTLAVTEDTMYWNVDFVNQCSVSELTFILIHEMLHMVMQHSVRFRNRKNHMLWNIACDLYINTYISAAFGCVYGGGEVSYRGGMIKVPDSGIHLATMDEIQCFDFGETPPEILYDMLMKENANGVELIDPNDLNNGELPKITIDNSLAPIQGGGQSNMTETLIMEIAEQLKEVMLDLSEESIALQDLQNELATDALKLREQASNYGEASPEYMNIQARHNEKIENANTLNEVKEKVDEDVLEIAEISAKLSLGTITKSTAENIVDKLNKVADSCSESNKNYAQVKLQNNKALVKAESVCRDSANTIAQVASQVPRQMTVDGSQMGGGGNMGGQPPQMSGILPDEITMPPSDGSGSGSDNDRQVEAQQKNGQGQDQNNQNQDGQNQGQDGQGQSSDGQNQDGQGQGSGGQANNPSGQNGQNQGQGQDSQSADSIPDGGDLGNANTSTGTAGAGGGNQRRTGGMATQGDKSALGTGAGAMSQSNGSASSSGNQQKENKSSGSKSEYDELFGDGKQTNIGSSPTVRVRFNGKEITAKVHMDIKSSVAGKSAEKNKLRQSKSKDTLERIKFRVDEQRAKGKLDDGSNGNSVEGGAERELEIGVSHLVDWKQIFKNRFSTKNRMVKNNYKTNMQRVARTDLRRGKHELRDYKVIKNIIIGIDVSGSVSQAQLQSYLSEIWGLLTRYKDDFQDISGELVYWSTNVGDSGIFTNQNDLTKVAPISTGGTDIRPFFQYVCKQIKTETGKMEKIKLKDCPLILVITDGCFSQNYADFASELGSKVIWMIDGDARNFNPPFGLVAELTSYE